MCFLLAEITEKFSYTLKHKRPHPSPPLLSQGREKITASRGTMTLNP